MKVLESVKITEVNFVPVKPHGGLLGFVSCVFNDSFYFSSIAVHSRPSGGIRLVYPRIRGVDAFHPIKRSIGVAIENAVDTKYEELVHRAGVGR